ncbi:hypothetical protein V5O48_013275 [Marasmius crinis-equi]|uniref:Uncharacterized protein n=1 Tax=Marasmius crinis-equi TaxID=585013 RepID=A0ABR3F0J0_9AGAR
MPPYIVKTSKSLPAGTFRLKLHGRTVGMGKERYVDLDEEERYIVPTDADILFVPHEEERSDNDDKRILKVGSIYASMILRSLLNNDHRWGGFQEICDDHSAELARMASDLFDQDGDHKETERHEANTGKF